MLLHLQHGCINNIFILTKAVDILKKHNLKRTSCREKIINSVLSANKALSENEIKSSFRNDYDRTTFYRTLKTLEQNNIIHKIVVDNQLVKYALSENETSLEKHVHFYCNKCHTVECLDDVLVKQYDLPEGYSEKTTEVLIKGICAKCKNKD